MEQQVEPEYIEYLERLEQEATDAREQGSSQEEIEEAVRAGAEDGSRENLANSQVAEEERAAIIEEGRGRIVRCPAEQ